MYKFNKPYVRNKGVDFTPIYLPGENYSFYFNSDIIISDTTSSNFYLSLLNPDGSINSIICILQRLYIAGIVGYNFYVEDFVFPLIEDGYYFFGIHSLSGSELYRSNSIIVNSFCLETTTQVKFRHNDQLYGFRYDLLPNFYQKFRLPLNQINSIDIKSEREQYRQSSNGRDLRNSKSFRDIVLTLEMYWSNDDDYQALSAMLEHYEIFISNNRVMDMSQVKVELPNSFSTQSKGTLQVIVQDYGINYSALDNYGDHIFWGGNTNNFLNTFVQG